MPLYVGLGVVLSLLRVAGFVLGVAGASAGVIGLVSGILSGFALFATVASAGTGRSRQPRAADHSH